MSFGRPSKPVLVISCSAAKQAGTAAAFDLYSGGIYQLIKSRCADFRTRFTCLILSARYGLISSETFIDSYDEKMCSRTERDKVKHFVDRHAKAVKALLRQTSKEGSRLYVCLPNDYLHAFDECLGTERDKFFNLFDSHYVSRGHKGIGELRGRVSKVLTLESKRHRPLNALQFRSGVSNKVEGAYIDAGCSVGTSLAHINRGKQTELFQRILDSTKSRATFIDNGLITLKSKGLKVDTDWVFSEYLALANTLPVVQSKRLHLVVPDDLSPDMALSIVARHAASIRVLSRLTQIILPIHSCKNIEQHALNMMQLLGFPRNIRLGIPCLTNKAKNLDFALTVPEIDRLLSIPHPSGKGALFKSVHMLGLSDASRKLKLAPRMLVAQLHGLKRNSVSMDACRTPSLFGYNPSGTPRIGTKTATRLRRETPDEVLSSKVITHPTYVQYSLDDELFRNDNEVGFVTGEFYSLIESETIDMFWQMYNALLKNEPNFLMPSMARIDMDDAYEVEEAIQKAWELTSIKAIDIALFNALKEHNWRDFSHVIPEIVKMTKFQSRYDAIRLLFEGDSNGQRAA